MDFFFYKTVSNKREKKEIRLFWENARKTAEYIRDTYERESEKKYILSIKRPDFFEPLITASPLSLKTKDTAISTV